MNAPGPPPAVRTTCPYCGVGCGVLAAPDGLGGATIAGDPEHPANFGRLCSKGAALGETLGLETRLLHPMLRQHDGSLARVDWDQALTRVADGFKHVIERHGPDAVAFYLSGQLLTEDYYVANKLMKGFLGSANVDTNSRLCMASSVAGHRRAFGADTVPGLYEDLDQADLIVLVGSNAAWCHPVLFRRIQENRSERGARLVVIDPRRTATAEEADLHLAIKPGMDTALFCGLLVRLADRDVFDRAYVSNHTTGFELALQRAAEIAPDVAAVARTTGLDAADVAAFYDLFAATERAVTCYSQGVNQSAQGTDKVNAIINCHLATGRIGKPGMGPFSLTGQPNAMGGREVGGLANQLAAHMNFEPAEIDRVRRFWDAPRIATHEGLKAVQMFDAIERGEIKALWVMATNPAVSLPRAGAVRDALRKLELFVVSENVLSNDTVNSGAHILLPAAAWGEKDGTVTNSERRISRQRGFLPLPGEAKPDWWIVSEVARRMGFADAFAYAIRRRRFPRACRAARRSKTTARATSISARSQRMNDAAFDALDPVHLADARGRTGRRRHASSPRAASSRPTARRASSRRMLRRCARRPSDDLSVRAQHRPRARPVAHHDAHGTEPAPRPAQRLSRSSRCIPAMRALFGLTGFRARRDRARRRHLQGLPERRPAARLAVRADPLEWRNRLVGARLRSGRAAHRSVLGPARGEGDAGAHRAGRVRLARLCAHARAGHAAGGHLVDARRAARRHRHADRDRRTAEALARPRGHDLMAGDRRRIHRPAARHLSRGRVPRRDGSKLRCSSGRPTRRRNGTPSRRCSSADALADIAAPHAAVRPRGRRPRRNRPGDLRLLRRRAQRHPRRDRVEQRHQCRGDRQGAARGHQLRLVPAGTEEDRA